MLIAGDNRQAGMLAQQCVSQLLQDECFCLVGNLALLDNFCIYSFSAEELVQV
jgi:hypothetical protein